MITITDLKRLGYRPLDPKHWAKPVGYNLFVVELKDKGCKFTNYFTGANNKTLVYDSKDFDEDATIGSLKYKEGCSCISTGAFIALGKFEFLSKEQELEEYL